jgi:hypothetical protein
MRTLTHIEIVRCLDKGALQAAEAALPLLDDNRQAKGDWIARGVAEGFYNGSYISHEGENVATLIWSKTFDPERVLNINAVAALVSRDISDIIQAACVKLAKAQECDVIEFHTRRPGMVRKTEKYGYQLHSVVLRKYL